MERAGQKWASEVRMCKISVFFVLISALFSLDKTDLCRQLSSPTQQQQPTRFSLICICLFSFSLCIVYIFVFSSALLAEGTVTGVTSPARLRGCCQGNKCPFYEWETGISQAEGWGADAQGWPAPELPNHCSTGLYWLGEVSGKRYRQTEWNELLTSDFSAWETLQAQVCSLPVHSSSTRAHPGTRAFYHSYPRLYKLHTSIPRYSTLIKKTKVNKRSSTVHF